MPDRKARILLVDDSAEMVALLAEELTDAGYETVVATDGTSALALARADRPDAAISDLRMAGLDGFDVLQGLRDMDPAMPVLIMTAFGSIDSAVDAMRRGAAHYVTKPFRIEEILLQLERALQVRRLAEENRALRALAREAPDGIVGASASMRRIHERIDRLADADVPVLIRGESGTGKERVARALHFRSSRANGPFVAVNCAALPASLLESELFGHARGSFTGAAGARRGLFVQADGGTLFLDEIGDMPLELQAHLLRVLEDGEVRAVGADATRQVNVRLIAATNQDLSERIKQGRFRADLYYRLDVVPIELPPLRDRASDVPLLAEAFLARQGPRTTLQRLSPEVMRAMERYPWPGNVRELENLIRRMAVLVSAPVATLDDLAACAPALVGEEARSAGPPLRREMISLRQMQDDYIGWVVRQCEGNKTRAAEILGIDVSTIHRRERAQTER